MKKYLSTHPTIEYTAKFDTFTHTMLRASEASDELIDDEILSVLASIIEGD
jgi:hypothetical protein